MCNLYSFTKPQDAARKLARVARDITGSMPFLPAIFPNVLPFQEVLDCCNQGRKMSHPPLFTELCFTRDYARQMTNELRKEIQNSRQVMSQSRRLIAKTVGMLKGGFAAPQED